MFEAIKERFAQLEPQALVMAASQLGINVGAAIAGLGVVGIAVGFAARDSLANVISGIIIFLDKPLIVGDWITVEDRVVHGANEITAFSRGQQ